MQTHVDSVRTHGLGSRDITRCRCTGGRPTAAELSTMQLMRRRRTAWRLTAAERLQLLHLTRCRRTAGRLTAAEGVMLNNVYSRIADYHAALCQIVRKRLLPLCYTCPSICQCSANTSTSISCCIHIVLEYIDIMICTPTYARYARTLYHIDIGLVR